MYSKQFVQNSVNFLLRSQTTWIYRFSCKVWPTYTPIQTTWNYSSVRVLIYRFSGTTGKGKKNREPHGDQHAQNRKCSQFLRSSNFYFFLLALKYFILTHCLVICVELDICWRCDNAWPPNKPTPVSVLWKMPSHFEEQNSRTCGALLGQSPVHILAGSNIHRSASSHTASHWTDTGFLFLGKWCPDVKVSTRLYLG